MTIEVALVISIVSVAFSVFFGLKNNKRSDTKEIEARIAWETKVTMNLDNINRNMEEIKDLIRGVQNDVKDHEGRIVKLEASYKAEHKRLDEVFQMAELKNGGNHDEQ